MRELEIAASSTLARRSEGLTRPSRATRVAKFATFLAIPLLMALSLLPGPARAQTYRWLDGSIAYQAHLECINGTYEQLTGQYVSYWGKDDASAPVVGDVYWGRMVISVLGNSCEAPGIFPEVTLPPNTSFAVSQTAPVRCFYGSIGGPMSELTGQTNTSTGHPFCESPFQGNYGAALSFGFQLAVGKSFEIWFPLVSTSTMSGTATNSYLNGYLHTIADVNDWSVSQQGVFVGASAAPDVYYPNPDLQSLTSSSVRLLANINNRYTSGTSIFDWGKTTAYELTNTALGQDALALSNAYSSAQLYDDLSGLSAGTTYHWRIRYVVNGGATYAGADHAFTTLGAGAVAPKVTTQPLSRNMTGRSRFQLQAIASGTPTPTVLWQLSPDRGATWTNIANSASQSFYSIATPAMHNFWYRAVFTNSAGTAVSDPALLSVRSVGAYWRGDFDGDGKSDILWRNVASGQNTIWLGGNAATRMTVLGVNVLSWQIAGVGDFDGDGKSDILWRHAPSGSNTIWKSANGNAPQALSTMADGNWQVAGVADFTGDGKADILWRNYATGANLIWRSALSTSQQAVAAMTDLAWQVAGVADFDGDAKADILWRNASTGANLLWKSALSTTAQTLTRFANLDWQVAGVADFDGDHKADILWRNRATGGDIIWKSGLSTTQQSVTGITDLNWMVAGVGDYNGDGKADILWRNRGTGAGAIWKSASSSTQQAVSSVTTLAWVVAM
ncbi:FG-GAP repeat domain-containing protein [Lysobacter fragariae]